MTEVVELVDASRNRRLEVHRYSNDGPLVVFAHGWVGHPDRFTRLLTHWHEAGFDVAAPVFPRSNAYVENPTWDEMPDQARDLPFVARALGAERYGLAGFSMGAINVLDAVFAQRVEPRPVCAVAIGGGLGFVGGHVFDSLPLLVVHATGDPVVPYEEAEKVFALAHEPKALLSLGAATHAEGVQDDPAPEVSSLVEGTTTAFLRSYLS